jgi:hypothetical protein
LVLVIWKQIRIKEQLVEVVSKTTKNPVVFIIACYLTFSKTLRTMIIQQECFFDWLGIMVINPKSHPDNLGVYSCF